MGNIVQLGEYQRNRKNIADLKKNISNAGWSINSDPAASLSEACVYLVDTSEPAILMFGCAVDKLALNSQTSVHWGHFVLAYDVIADPEMPFDETHKNITIEMAISSLPGLPVWGGVHKKIMSAGDGYKPHIVVVIDRANMEQPAQIIVAYSTEPLMNEKSITSIVRGYLDG